MLLKDKIHSKIIFSDVASRKTWSVEEYFFFVNSHLRKHEQTKMHKKTIEEDQEVYQS